MERRELIKLVTLATGSVLSAPLLGALLTGCENAKVDEDYIPQFFKEQEFIFVKSLIDVIVPKSDSPSATDVGVHQIIDVMVGTVYYKSQREEYRKQLSALMNYLESNSLELEAIKSLSNSLNKNDKQAKSALLEIKQQTIAYYLSTEEVCKNHLNYLPIPGEYQPCISLDEVGGKAWAL